MKALYAEFTAKPGCEERIAAMVAEYARAVRLETGNVVFDPYTRAGSPREFFVFELYRDEEAFQAHLDSPHNKRFNDELAMLIEGKVSSLVWLTPVA